MTDEQKLWRAVLMQALHDLCMGKRVHQLQVMAWSLGMTKDFIEVCDLAGVSADKIRTAIRALSSLDEKYRKLHYAKIASDARAKKDQSPK